MILTSSEGIYYDSQYRMFEQVCVWCRETHSTLCSREVSPNSWVSPFALLHREGGRMGGA